MFICKHSLRKLYHYSIIKCKTMDYTIQRKDLEQMPMTNSTKIKWLLITNKTMYQYKFTQYLCYAMRGFLLVRGITLGDLGFHQLIVHPLKVCPLYDSWPVGSFKETWACYQIKEAHMFRIWGLSLINVPKLLLK